MEFTTLSYEIAAPRLMKFPYAVRCILKFQNNSMEEDGTNYMNEIIRPYWRCTFMSINGEDVAVACWYDEQPLIGHNDLYVSILNVLEDYRGNEYADKLIDHIQQENKRDIVLTAENEALLHGYYLPRNWNLVNAYIGSKDLIRFYA